MSDKDTFYPLAVGNEWTYKTKDGKLFKNMVTAVDGDTYSMQNTEMPRTQRVRKEGSTFLADNFETDNFQVFLRDDLQKGDSWEINYRAGKMISMLFMTVLETGASIEVEGKTYDDVVIIKGDLKMRQEDNLVDTNFMVQYYYARGVGLVLTTTSYVDSMALVDYELKDA